MFKEFYCLKNVELKSYTTIKIGGKADFIIFPKNIKELIKILKIIKKNNLKYIFLGNGSNILFDSDGFGGVVISLKYFNKISLKKSKSVIQNFEFVRAGAGVNLFALNKFCCDNGLSGLEWSYGIPASLGGLVFMNGGSFGHEICEFVDSLVIFDLEIEKVVYLDRDQINFEYRTSNLKKCVVLSVVLKLKIDKKENVQKQMNEYFKQKKEIQPYDKFSLGSVFKIIFKDEPIYPAKLIDNLGLKGVKIGGAEISTKHAGFIINSGDATSKDVLDLIELIKKRVSQYGVELQEEIIVCKK